MATTAVKSYPTRTLYAGGEFAHGRQPGAIYVLKFPSLSSVPLLHPVRRLSLHVQRIGLCNESVATMNPPKDYHVRFHVIVVAGIRSNPVPPNQTMNFHPRREPVQMSGASHDHIQKTLEPANRVPEFDVLIFCRIPFENPPVTGLASSGALQIEIEPSDVACQTALLQTAAALLAASYLIHTEYREHLFPGQTNPAEPCASCET